MGTSVRRSLGGGGGSTYTPPFSLEKVGTSIALGNDTPISTEQILIGGTTINGIRAIRIGNNISGVAQNQTIVGTNAQGHANQATSFGYNSEAGNTSVTFGSTAGANKGSSATFGGSAQAGIKGVVVGSYSSGNDEAIVIGYSINGQYKTGERGLFIGNDIDQGLETYYTPSSLDDIFAIGYGNNKPIIYAYNPPSPDDRRFDINAAKLIASHLAEYASTSAAVSDVNLPSGAIYRVTGSDQLYIK